MTNSLGSESGPDWDSDSDFDRDPGSDSTLDDDLGLDLDERTRIVERSMAHYDDRLDRERVADIAGRHRPAVETAVEKTVSWGRQPDAYLERVFDAESVRDGRLPERGADAPAQVVLPRNDRGDLAPYVLAQCLLAGCSYVVRPSSREAGEYVARTYHESLCDAVRETLPADRAESVVAALDLLDPAEFGASDLARVAPERVQLVLFGDDATLAALESEFAAQGVDVATAVRMGEGRSSSVLADVDADSDSLDDYCRAIARSAAFDKGDDCTSTSILYVVGDFDVYEDALDSLSAARNELVAGEDFAVPSDEQLSAAREQLRAVHPGETLAGDRLTVVECSATAPVREFPVPLVQVKRVENRNRLLTVMGADFAERPSLATSVFTDDPATFDALEPDLPATLVKDGRPTHDIDLFEPHQGRHLVADLL
jgi:hypothetical protein